MARDDVLDSAPRTKVFISYSRVDSTFADIVAESLEERGFAPLIDRIDIERGEEWWSRVVDMITDSSAVIFVISPDSVASVVCTEELDLIRKLSLRIVPVLFREPLGGLQIPHDISRFDWIPCDEFGRRYHAAAQAALALNLAKQTKEPPVDIERKKIELAACAASFYADVRGSPVWAERLDAIVRALSLDSILWRREQRSWLVRARAWDEVGRPTDLVLPSGDIAALRGWFRRRPRDAAMPDLVVTYLEASERHEREERNALRRYLGRAYVPPVRQAQIEGKLDRSLRFAAAAIILADDPGFTVVPELAAAAAWLPGASMVRSLLHHDGSVLDICFSDDGRRVVTGSSDTCVRIWDSFDGSLLAKLEGHARPVTRVGASGGFVVSASDDCSIKLWDVATRTALTIRIPFHMTVDFDATCSSFLICSHSSATLFDIKTQRQIVQTPAKESNLVCASVSPDGSLIATGCADGSISIYRTNGRRRHARFVGHLQIVRQIRFSADSRQIVSSSDDGTARIWDIAGKAELSCLGEPSPLPPSRSDSPAPIFAARYIDGAVTDTPDQDCVRGVVCSAFSPDGKRVVTAGHENTLRIWDVATGTLCGSMVGHERSVRSVVFAPDSTLIASASEDATARIWCSATHRVISTIQRHENAIVDANFSPDGKLVATVSPTAAYVCRTDNGARALELGGNEAKLWTASFSRDGRWVVTAAGEMLSAFDAAARVYDIQTGAEIARLCGHEAGLRSASFNGDATKVVTASKDQTVRVWAVSSATELQRFVGHSGVVRSAEFDGSGSRIVSVGDDGTARIWDVNSGVCTTVYREHNDRVNGGAFSPDGSRVVSGGDDRVGRVWNAYSGKTEVTLQGHTETINSVAFSPDGKFVVTASDDLTARVWNAESGFEILTLASHRAPVNSASFDSEGGRVLTASTDHWAFIWDTGFVRSIPPDPLVYLASALLNGVGTTTRLEADDVLLSQAPGDLLARICELWPDRMSDLARYRTLLNSALHPNCYRPQTIPRV